ncbi:MAG: hypothetical protein Q8P30_04670 [Candidatus Uhrbacteria bacterium]|nr:hypothetical protein [Candidatus Uhrbacteria bacterium]
MPRQLRIPFEPNISRRTSRRDIWLWASACLVLFFVFGVYRVWITRDTTSSFRPIETTASIRVIKSPRNINIIHENIGSSLLIPGGPWTIDDAFVWSNREFTLHFGDSGLEGITIDSKLNEEIWQTAEQFGFQIQELNGKSLISTNSTTTESTKSRITISGIGSRFGGEIFSWTDGPEVFSYILSQKGLKVRGLGGATNEQYNLALPEGTEILASMTLLPDEVSNSQLNSFGLSGLPSALRNEMERVKTHILIGRDEAGYVISINLETGAFELEALAEMAEEMINRSSLSTTALTMEDGTTVSEIRSNSDTITSDIRAEEDYSLILVKNEKADVIRITKTAQFITISNRNIPLDLAEFSTKSQCLASAGSWVKIETLSQLHNIQGGSYLLRHFSEIAIGKRSSMLCW